MGNRVVGDQELYRYNTRLKDLMLCGYGVGAYG